VDIPRGRIDEDAAAFVHLVLLGFASPAEQSASSGTNEVVNRDPLHWKQLILL
jgi:hypothetical protein